MTKEVKDTMLEQVETEEIEEVTLQNLSNNKGDDE